MLAKDELGFRCGVRWDWVDDHAMTGTSPHF